MRIVQLTPGTGTFHCGNCLRDAALVAQMRRQGHDVLMVPLYLPPVMDGADVSNGTPLFMGGINMYLRHKSPMFRRSPAWVRRLLDSTPVLRIASRRAGMTSARDLGELTIGMLRGEDPAQAEEHSRFIEFLDAHGRPDVVCLSNAMLIGMAETLKRRLGVPVVCTLSGEDAFADSLPEPYASRAWDLLCRGAEHVDAFVAVSKYYAGVMTSRLDLSPDRVHIVHNGIDTSGFAPGPPPEVPTIGYMARMHHGKGLATLVDAFILLQRRARVPDARLHIAGACTPQDHAYVENLRRKLRAAGHAGRSRFLTNITAEQKSAFLASLSVLSVPAMYGEAFGLYVLEAWASGVPVVQPRHAGFVELLEHTGGGVLCEPGDAVALAEALESVLLDRDSARAMAERGRRATLEYYNVARMAREVLAVMQTATAAGLVEPAQSERI